jgi:hypothetical protein
VGDDLGVAVELEREKKKWMIPRQKCPQLSFVGKFPAKNKTAAESSNPTEGFVERVARPVCFVVGMCPGEAEVGCLVENVPEGAIGRRDG